MTGEVDRIQRFSDVRVHVDDQATKSARAIGALAYTVGRHTAFGTDNLAQRLQPDVN